MLQAEALRKLDERFKPSSAIAAYKNQRNEAAIKKEKQAGANEENKLTSTAKELAAQFIAEAGNAAKKKKKKKSKSKTSSKKKAVDVISLSSTPDKKADADTSPEAPGDRPEMSRLDKLLLGDDEQLGAMKKKSSPLQRQFTGRNKKEYFKNLDKKKFDVSESDLEDDRKKTLGLLKFFNRLKREGKPPYDKKKRPELTEEDVLGKNWKKKLLSKKSAKPKKQAAASSSYKGPLTFEQSSDSDSSSSDQESSSSDDEDEESSSSSSSDEPAKKPAPKSKGVRKQGAKKKSDEKKGAGKPNRRGVKQAVLNYDEVKAKHVAEHKKKLPKKKDHLPAPASQDVDRIIKKIKIPLAKHRWNRKTYEKYAAEFSRYAFFIHECGLDAKPEHVAPWSLQAYTGLLAETSGFDQSRAQYLSNMKVLCSAIRPFNSKLKATYSTCFGLLSRMVAIRSKSEGIRLSHIIKMVLTASADPAKIIYTGEIKQGSKKIKSSIDLATGAGFLVRGWFGMLRADDLMCTTCTSSAAGRRIKFVVTSSKTDALCHGAEFSLSCSCDQTAFCPAHDVVPICPVHAISDARFEYCRKLLGNVQNARDFFKKTIEILEMDIPGKHYSPHSLRIGAITAAFEGGLELAMVNKFARRRELQTAIGYTSNAALCPDDVRISWPVVKGATIKDIFENGS
eukprot:g2531.t1